MRSVIIIAALFAAFLSVEGCAVNDATPSPEATVQTHFFPLNNGLVYTFQEYNNHTTDTVQWKLVTGRPGYPNVLVNYQTGDTIYRIGLTHDANGNLAALLSNDTQTLMVLDGELQKEATWMADVGHKIRAKVVDQYDDYYLEGRTTHFTNVLVVQYYIDQDGQDDQIPSSYILRFFAKDHGMIAQREIAGQTEISSLQLISIE